MGEGYFEELIRTVLLENPHGCEVVMVPSHLSLIHISLTAP